MGNGSERRSTPDDADAGGAVREGTAVRPRGAVVEAQVVADGDAELVDRAVGGDRWAAEALFRRHAPPLLRFATRLLARSDEADDLVQDAFAEALRDLHGLDDPSAFRSWLYQIAVNRARNRFRRRKLQRVLGLDRTVEDSKLALLAGDTLEPDALLELRLVDEVLARLPGNERVAWIVRHVEGHTIEELAAILGCSAATAKRRVAAAEAAVRAHVERRSTSPRARRRWSPGEEP